MAAVVAHEVRNPLAGIKGAIQVLMSRRTATDAELPVMRDVVARIDSLGELINDLMLFARPRPPRPSTFPHSAAPARSNLAAAPRPGRVNWSK